MTGIMNEVVRYYLDEHVAHAVANGLAQRGVDVLTASAAHMLHASDREHLAFATSQNRTVFSQDADVNSQITRHRTMG